jgi:hypothetical protein
MVAGLMVNAPLVGEAALNVPGQKSAIVVGNLVERRIP